MPILQLANESASFADDLAYGLALPQKAISPRFFYDEQGSALFNRICDLPQYYLTRIETSLLRRAARDLGREERSWQPKTTTLLELGPGDGSKADVVLGSLAGIDRYVPVEISPGALDSTMRRLQETRPSVEVTGVLGDFLIPGNLSGLQNSRTPGHRLSLVGCEAGLGTGKLCLFLGSTIGNLDPWDAVRFLMEIADWIGPHGRLLLGTDLKKDPVVLESAYNDPLGLTAQFNLNVLLRANRELGTNFELEDFEHVAIYNERRSRIEMHLRSLRAQEIRLSHHRYPLAKGETIHTESCHKYTPEEVACLVRAAGWQPIEAWKDEHDFYQLSLLEALPQADSATARAA